MRTDKCEPSMYDCFRWLVKPERQLIAHRVFGDCPTPGKSLLLAAVIERARHIEVSEEEGGEWESMKRAYKELMAERREQQHSRECVGCGQDIRYGQHMVQLDVDTFKCYPEVYKETR